MDTDLLAEGSEQALVWVLGLIPSTVTSRDNRPPVGTRLPLERAAPSRTFHPCRSPPAWVFT